MMRDCGHIKDLFFKDDLSQKEKSDLQRHLEDCADCREQYEEYRVMIDSLHGMEVKKCPEEVADRAFKITAAESKNREGIGSKFADLLSFNSRNLSMTFSAIAAILIIIMIIPVVKDRYFNKPPYTQEELHQGIKQVKMLLGYIKHVNQKAQDKFEEKALKEGIAKPMNYSAKALDDVFEPG